MVISLLGPLAVDGAPDGLSPRDRVVLSALAFRPGSILGAEQLAEALWGDDPPASSAKVVQGCISRLRRVLGHDAIETTTDGYRLMLGGEDIDSVRFEGLVDRGRELAALGQHERAAVVIGSALSLWNGRPLADLEDWTPARIEIARLEERRREAEELRIASALSAGQAHEILAECRSLAEAEPLRERRWVMLATALYQTDRQGEALRALHVARTALATELGVDPGPGLSEIEQAILRQDAGLLVDLIGDDPAAACPYPGLVSYDVGDAEVFFGRGADIETCLSTLRRHGVLVVAGPSGCGKTSLIRAGLVPALQRAGETVELVTLGNRPGEMLAALPDTGVLVVDQVEQALAACVDTGRRTEILSALATRAELQRLVLVIRADVLGELSAHPAGARLFERGLFLLGPIAEEGLRQAIVTPAKHSGLLVEPGLVDLLVREVDGEPGALPLLSHALRQTWQRRDGRTLTVDGYRSTGGIRGAIAQTAEAVYQESSDTERRALRDLMMRMVTTTAGREPVRIAVPRRVAPAGDPDRNDLVERLIAARLVTSDGDGLELAHESIIRAWPRFRSWLDDDVEGQQILRHLTLVADTWDSMDRPASELYRGVRLARALEWRNDASPRLTPTEAAFLDASADLADRERAETLRRSNEQARSNRRLRRALSVVAVALVLAVGTGVVALDQARRADDEAAAAERSASEAAEAASTAADARAAADRAATGAEARRLGANALTARDIDHALLLAVEAVRLDDSADTQASLLGVLSRAPQLVGAASLPEPLLAVAPSPDGRYVAAAGAFSGVWILDAETLQVITLIERPARAIEFSPDGTRLAVLANEYTPLPDGPILYPLPLEVFDTQDFAPVDVQFGGQPGQSVAFDASWSEDGTSLTVAYLDFNLGRLPRLLAWDVAEPAEPVLDINLTAHPIKVVSSPDGAVIHLSMATAAGFELRAYDRASGAVLRKSALGGEALAIAPGGDRVATMSGDEVVMVASDTYEEISRLRRHAFPISALAFSRDGTLLASASREESAIVWDLARGDAVEQFDGHAGDIWGVDFSPDGSRLFTVSLDRRLLAWDVTGGQRYLRRVFVVDPQLPVERFSLSPDGTTGVWIGERSFRVVDPLTGELGEPVAVGGTIQSVAWHPSDAERFLTGGDDGVVRSWNTDGRLLAQSELTDAVIVGLDVSADGRRVLAAERAGRLHVLDLEGLAPDGGALALDDRLLASTLTADGSHAVALTWDLEAMVIELTTGDIVHSVPLGFVPSVAVTSPDGERLAVGGSGGEVGLIDLHSGRWIHRPTVGHRNAASTVAFAPDGLTFTSGGSDGRVVLWDGLDGKHLSTVQPGSPVETTFPFLLPDGHTVLVASSGGAVHRWSAASEDLVAAACSIITRELSADEWHDARGDVAQRATCP